MISEVKAQKNKEVIIDKIISGAVMTSFIVLTFQYLILLLFNLLGTSSASFVQMLSKILVGLIFVMALPYVLKRKLRLFILLYGFGVVVFGYNFLVFPENHSYLINLIFPFFFMALPSFIYVLSLKNLEVFKEITEKVAFIIFILGTILGGFIFTGNASAGAYSMSLSYYMLLPALVFLENFFDRHKPAFMIYFLIALIVIVALGSRGALLCIAGYVILRVVSPRQKFTPAKIFIYVVAVIALVLSILNYEKILLFINKLFLEYGIQSRTIALLLQDEVHLSGRDALYNVIWESLVYKPYIGYGLGGDQYLLEGSYVHNIFLEILVNFGLLIGIVLISLIILIILRALIISSASNYNIVILWISLGFIHLFVSGTYLADIKFWVLMGLLFKILQLKLNTMKIKVKKVGKI